MADNASDNRQAATSQRERVGGKFKTKQGANTVHAYRYKHDAGKKNDGKIRTELTRNHCASTECAEQPYSHWPSVPAVIVPGAAAAGSTHTLFRVLFYYKEMVWSLLYVVPLAASNVSLLHSPPLHCLEPPAAPLPGSPRAAH